MYETDLKYLPVKQQITNISTKISLQYPIHGTSITQDNVKSLHN